MTAWAARWRAALMRDRTSATKTLEISAAAFSLGSGSLGGSGRLTSLALGCAHNNAILSWRAPISIPPRREPRIAVSWAPDEIPRIFARPFLTRHQCQSMREDADLGNPWQWWFAAQGLKWKGGAFTGEEELSMIERGDGRVWRTVGTFVGTVHQNGGKRRAILLSAHIRAPSVND